MRHLRPLVPLLALFALAALASPARAAEPIYDPTVVAAAKAWGIIPAVQERRIQDGIRRALASRGARRTPSGASIEASIRKGLATALRQDAARKAVEARRGGVRRVLSLWGDNEYYPAHAWVNNGNTITTRITYFVESLPSWGCRNMEYLNGYLNGGSWPLDYQLDHPNIETSAGGDFTWFAHYERYGDGYLGSAVAAGPYTNSGTETIRMHPTVGTRAKGASEVNWHSPHAGVSGWAGLWCH